MISKKAQAWGFDLIIASIIFIGGIIIFYLYILNASAEAEETLDALFYQGSLIADDLLSEGYPADWTADSVTKIGILSNNKVNETKLERFYNLSIQDYAKTKVLFNTRYDYYLTFSEPIIIQNVPIELIGMKIESPKNLIKVGRLTIYQNNPIEINIYIWQS